MKRITAKTKAKRLIEREGLGDWFIDKVNKAQGSRCENCGRALRGNLSEIAHILPKSTFKSIATDPDNYLLLCSNLVYGSDGCHDLYDTTWSNAVKMPVWKTAIDKYKRFRHKIQKKTNKAYRFFENYIDENQE